MRLEPTAGYDIIRFLPFAESVLLRAVVVAVGTAVGKSLDKLKLVLVCCKG